jgi:hypothetical protein
MEQQTMEDAMNELDNLMGHVECVSQILTTYGKGKAAGVVLAAVFEIVHEVVHDLWLNTNGNRVSVRSFLYCWPIGAVDEDDDE